MIIEVLLCVFFCQSAQHDIKWTLKFESEEISFIVNVPPLIVVMYADMVTGDILTCDNVTSQQTLNVQNSNKLDPISPFLLRFN